MTKEEYGELLKYLGMLKVAIIRLREKEREHSFLEMEYSAIQTLISAVPLLEEHIKN